jgi:hypothetical protein
MGDSECVETVRKLTGLGLNQCTDDLILAVEGAPEEVAKKLTDYVNEFMAVNWASFCQQPKPKCPHLGRRQVWNTSMTELRGEESTDCGKLLLEGK